MTSIDGMPEHSNQCALFVHSQGFSVKAEGPSFVAEFDPELDPIISHILCHRDVDAILYTNPIIKASCLSLLPFVSCESLSFAFMSFACASFAFVSFAFVSFVVCTFCRVVSFAVLCLLLLCVFCLCVSFALVCFFCVCVFCLCVSFAFESFACVCLLCSGLRQRLVCHCPPRSVHVESQRYEVAWCFAFRRPVVLYLFTALSSNGRSFISASVWRCVPVVNGDVTTTSWYVGYPPTSGTAATSALTRISGSYSLMMCSVCTLSPQRSRRPAHQSLMWLWP